jgi:hypothetical protein
LLATQKLFRVFERVLDGPSVVVTFQNLFGCHRQIGCKKKIVSFFASWISAYYKKYRLMRNPIPYHLAGIDQSPRRFASLTKLYLLPILNIRSHFLWAGKAFAFLARSASGFLSFLAWQIENLCIALYSRNEMRLGHLFSSQRCVKTVCNQSKPPFWQPLMKLICHLCCQFYQSWPVFAMQSHIYRQSQWFATPGRLDLQSQNHQIQSPGIYNVLLCRADRISPITSTIDLSAAVMEQRIVQGNRNNTRRAKEFDQYECQDLPEFVDIPTTIWKETMVGIVSTLKIWVCKGQDTGYRLSRCTEDPAGGKTRENLCSWSRENWKKLLDYIHPCRNKCMHIGLPVFLLNLIKTSAGRYVFVYKPLKYVT